MMCWTNASLNSTTAIGSAAGRADLVGDTVVQVHADQPAQPQAPVALDALDAVRQLPMTTEDEVIALLAAVTRLTSEDQVKFIGTLSSIAYSLLTSYLRVLDDTALVRWQKYRKRYQNRENQRIRRLRQRLARMQEQYLNQGQQQLYHLDPQHHQDDHFSALPTATHGTHYHHAFAP
eukprot:m.213471 g.213471  ORF g.213471 m.213471 type:complete len:177 (+) comp16956_c0_seq2:453-983(+)